MSAPSGAAFAARVCGRRAARPVCHARGKCCGSQLRETHSHAVRSLGPICKTKTSWRVSQQKLSSTPYEVKQGGLLDIDLPEHHANVQVATSWQEHCTVDVSPAAAAAGGITVDCDRQANRVLVRARPGAAEGTLAVSAVIPQVFDLAVQLARGNVILPKTVEGCVEITTGSGDISTGSIRGASITLTAGGAVTAKELEGTSRVSADRVTVRLLNGQQVRVRAAESVHLGGLYSPDAQVECPGAVSMSNCHGTTAVRGGAGCVTLEGVNGCADVSTVDGDIKVHFDAAAADTTSTIRSEGGNIDMSIAKGLEAELHVQGRCVADFGQEWRVTEKGAGLLRGNLTGRMAAAQGRPGNGGTDSSVGKIDLSGAKAQSLDGYFPQDQRHTHKPALIVVQADAGSVRLQTLAWMERIKRKHGMA